MKISEVLWVAANEYLWNGVDIYHRKDEFSCLAVGAADGLFWDYKNSEAVKFLKSLGCPIGALGSFKNFKYGTERQGARYAWLMFASMYAEELGL